jgi:energy-coupling factor transport system ATP-binding protein
MKLIEIKDLYFKYPFEEKYVLTNINLCIDSNESIAILGPNGSGKTTLIKHLNGILKPTKGEVFIEGKNTKEKSVAELSRIVGIVFQNPDHQLFSNTVFEEISFALINFGFNKEEIVRKVKEMLKYFNLEKYEESSPLLLSGGEKKRVALASVLCYDPKIIVLDEPTVGLDYFQRTTLINIIKKLKKEGKTIITITHDIDFALGVAERGIILKDGKIIKDDLLINIIYEEELLNEANLVQPTLAKIIIELEKNGIKLGRNITTVEEFIKKIENRLLRRGKSLNI